MPRTKTRAGNFEEAVLGRLFSAPSSLDCTYRDGWHCAKWRLWLSGSAKSASLLWGWDDGALDTEVCGREMSRKEIDKRLSRGSA